MLTRLEDLHFTLKAQYGDNFTGVTRPVDMKLPTQLCWADTPDEKTIAEAQAIADAWDWTEQPEEKITEADVNAKVNLLQEADKQTLIDLMLKEYLQSRPEVFKTITDAGTVEVSGIRSK